MRGWAVEVSGYCFDAAVSDSGSVWVAFRRCSNEQVRSCSMLELSFPTSGGEEDTYK
jgi:hypothetical protein